MLLGLINVTPDPIIFQIPGTLVRIGWYGLGYVVAVGVMMWVSQREAAWRHVDPRNIVNALILVAACALLGARLYHVVDQWGYYSQNLSAIVLPPYSGLALYGGIAGAIVGIVIYARRHGLSLSLALDICVPGTLFAQGIARWGNFFNQELYGPPTHLPWGITIGCDHRVSPWFCPPGADTSVPSAIPGYPADTTGFHPLFFYESALDIIGGFVALWLSHRHLDRLRDGDLASFWFIWYGTVRFLLETFRYEYDWKLLGVMPTAMAIGLVVVAFGIVSIVWRHRSPRPTEPADGEPTAGELPDADELPDAGDMPETALRPEPAESGS